VVTPVRSSDHDEWVALFRAYGQSNRLRLDTETIEAVWRKLHDRHHAVQGLVVRRTYSGPPVGLAHYRAFPRTLGPKAGCYVDDLFVDSAARGEGAASAVLAHLQRLAAARGWGAVRWLTAADNGRARTVYDGVAAPASLATANVCVA
jgi:GNAT superfamily N-acetyltransferase